MVGMVTKPAYSASFPPPAHVRDALGLKRNGELQERWQAYLEEADDAFCAAGISEDKLSVKHFLNRMLGMKVGVQNRVFGHFTTELDAKIKKAKEEHKFDDGVVDIRGNAVKIEPGYPKRMGEDPMSKVELRVVKVGVDRGITFAHATHLLQEKIDNIRGAVTIAYPMGLPDYDRVAACLDDDEDLSGSASGKEVMDPETACLWWAGKQMLREGQTLRDYIGKNEKTKVVCRVQKKGASAPSTETESITDSSIVHMMRWHTSTEWSSSRKKYLWFLKPTQL